ncbi:leucine-rich melanocyte differentiation-associated protein-like isoform X2 [Neocloeon triangulifer]|uniref:leucine-rich melanocyte differentiation-associated protein-like isoform X2 n=1 Tax=Neocloeon triangulifer TaxID=2078957 RepID=UPI00286F82DD|nr:leucine-rich melanocyte differentiation-associated protein-like isoform X2 [Neocloeon triangulifer]
MMEEDDSIVDLAHNYINTGAVNFNNNNLSYVGQECQRIPPTLAQLYGARVQSLDLSYNCLTSLKSLERFPHLHTLVLDNNLLTDAMQLPYLPELRTLSLNKNKICDLELLLNKIANNTSSLRHLSLLGNVACPNQLSDAEKDEEDYRRYRYYVLHCLPQLQFLDSTPVTPMEKSEAQRRGQYMKIIKPRTFPFGNNPPLILPDMNSSSYTPLPVSRRAAGDHQGAYGKCRFRYTGKNSEGNRFIQNQDL